MAFDKANWACGCNATAAPTIHSYKTADTAATVNTVGYFNSVAKEVRVGDAIYCFADTGGTPQAYWLTVNANSGTVVDVTDGLAVGTTDTD
jgi:hypothetical protein